MRASSTSSFPRLYVHVYASAACIFPVASYFLATVGWRPSDIGIGTAAAALAGVVATPAWGWLDDRCTWAPRAAVLTSGAAAMAIAATLRTAPHEVTWAAMALFGAAAGPLDPLLTTRVLESGVHSRRLGRLRAFGSLGWVLGLALAAVVMTAWTGRAELVPLAAGLLAVTAPVSWAARRTAAPVDSHRPHEAARPSSRLPLLPVLGVLVFTFPASFVVSALVQFTAGWAHQDLAAGPFLALAPVALAAALELPAFPWADRLAHRFAPLTLVAIASPLLALTTAALTFFPSSAVMIAVQPLVAVGVALLVVGQSRLLLLAAHPQRQASAQTLGAALSTGCGGLLAGAVGGHLADALGYRGLFAALAVVSVVGTAAGLLGALRRRRLPLAVDTRGERESEHAG